MVEVHPQLNTRTTLPQYTVAILIDEESIEYIAHQLDRFEGFLREMTAQAFFGGIFS